MVSLSRMLATHQNDKDVVTVKEEMDFISRYLQVMLYRYRGRLNTVLTWRREAGRVHTKDDPAAH